MYFQRRMLDVLLYYLLPYSLETRSATEPGARLVTRRTCSLQKLLLIALKVLVHIAMLAFCMGVSNLDSSLLVCALLLIELSAKSLYGKYILSSLCSLNCFINFDKILKFHGKNVANTRTKDNFRSWTRYELIKKYDFFVKRKRDLFLRRTKRNYIRIVTNNLGISQSIVFAVSACVSLISR